jgi:hypothetical protein
MSAPLSPLSPQYDSRASFYGKALVGENSLLGDGIWLKSYDTFVARIVNGKAKVYGTYSATTLRHIKEFLKQYGFKAISSKQIMADYGATV